jgi:hypothetical protein
MGVRVPLLAQPDPKQSFIGARALRRGASAQTTSGFTIDLVSMLKTRKLGYLGLLGLLGLLGFVHGNYGYLGFFGFFGFFGFLGARERPTPIR